MTKIIVMCVLFGIPAGCRAEVIASCNVGSANRIEVLREFPIADTHVYFLRQNGHAIPIFSDRESSRGTSVHAACVGRRFHALVLSGEFAANAVQGFVLTGGDGIGKVGRLDFAEKRRPRWLYLSKKRMLVIIPTWMAGETTKMYAAYGNTPGSNDETLIAGVDGLPTSHGYEVVDLEISGHLHGRARRARSKSSKSGLSN